MATDKARISYNPSRQYRAVVAQQGRVTLEADVNEGTHLGDETTRLHALDFVGPCGTPDDGYAITPVGTNDFEIGAGTMYLGGWRLRLEQAIRYTTQPDWLDATIDPLWHAIGSSQSGLAHALLYAREQEIVAVEDPALREVALGGPDTAGRTRLLQRVVLADTTNRTCAGAQKDEGKFWSAAGLDYDPATAELRSRARLQVTLVNTAPPASPCDPPAQSGYLGADNQLIRVQLTAFDPATGKGRFLWGYHNASTLYRCTKLDAVTLELANRPVSAEHAPRSGQAVQLLLAAANLGDGAYAAALTGHVATLATPYQPDTRRVTLPAAPPAAYASAASGPPLFLRLWEAELQFTLGTATELTGTGLAITITSTGAGPLSVGDYWSFAVRPATPNAVYPERLLAAAQPPDGPRQWCCSLAVLSGGTTVVTATTGGAASGGVTVVDDCRLPFDNLPELTAKQPGGTTPPAHDTDTCCCVTVDPSHAGELQALIDKFAGVADASVKFEPGEYVLAEPLRIDRRHNGLLLEACTGTNVVFRAAEERLEEFRYGMVIIAGAKNVTLRGLGFDIPACRVLDELRERLESVDYGLGVEARVETTAVGIYLRRVGGITLDRCVFQFATGEARCFGAAVLAHETTTTVTARESTFMSRKEGEGTVLTGILVVPIGTGKHGDPPVVAAVDGLMLDANRFGNLTYGALVAADCRAVAARGNVTRGCYGSFLLFDLPRDGKAYDRLQAPVGLPEDQSFDQTNEFVRATLGDTGLRETLVYGTLLWPSTAAPEGGDQPAAAKQIPLALDLTGNDFDSRPAEGDDAESGVALLVWDLHEGPTSAVTVTSNRVWNRSSTAPTAMLLAVSSLTVTGNVLVNDLRDPGTYFEGKPGEARFALLVVPGGRVRIRKVKDPVDLFAVTGNTMTGASNLRRWPRAEWVGRLPQQLAALLTWDFFNTET